jgi:gliding motility-associated-like protein
MRYSSAYFITIFTFSFFISTFHSSSQTATFNYTGSAQTWTVPVCVYSINVVVKGAKGGGTYGGNGATVTATLAVTPGQVLQINVGGTGGCPGTGFNGGGNGANASGAGNAGCGGGGASDIRTAPYGLGNRLVVAAGGGGMGGGDTDAQGGAGGCASGLAGASPFGVGGGGGSQTTGGSGGPPWTSGGYYGAVGALGNGGAGATDPCYNLGPGGGGGGGYYGGGGGGSDCWSMVPLGGGGGGGGSSFVPAGGTCVQGNNATQGQVVITYNATPLAGTLTASPLSICEGQTSTLTLTGHNGTIQWQSSVNGGATWTDITGATGTTYTTPPLFATTCYRVAVTCGSTVYSTMVCITVNPIPQVTISPASPAICTGQSSTITAGGANTYNWSGGLGTSASQTVSPANTTTYTVTGTSNGCTGSASVTVQVYPSPTITINPATPQICNGASVNITAGGGNTYNWSGGLGTSASQNVSPATTTTYTVTGTDANGCSGTASVTVTVHQNPVIGISPASPQICNGTSTTITANGGNTYSWSGGLGNSASQTISPTSTTTYTVTGTDMNGCTGTASVTVTVNPNPVINVNPSAPQICTGNSVTITAGGASTYAWSGGLGTGISHTVSPLTTNTYTVTGTDANGCTGTGSVTVTVNQNATITITPSTPQICNGASVTLNAGGGSTYSWSGGLGSGSSKTVSPTTTTTYTVTGTDANGCSGTASATVNVQPNPTVTISPSSPAICSGASATITSAGANTYNWSGGLGQGASHTVSPATTTTYSVTGTDANGCSGTASVTVSIHPDPVITASAVPPGICPGGSSDITAGGGVSYLWSDSLGQGATHNISPNVTTTYTVTGTDANGCTGTAQIQVEVYGDLTVSISPTNPVICMGDDIQLTATASGANASFIWDTGQNTADMTVSPAVTTDYSVSATDAQGCTGSAELTVTVEDLPNVDFEAQPLNGCVPLSVGFSNMSDQGSYLWTFGNGATSTNTNPAYQYTNSGLFTVSLTVTSSNGCINSLSVPAMIEVYPKPFAAFTSTADGGIDSWSSIQFTDLSIGAVSWLWNFGTQGGSSADQHPEYNFVAEGQYTVWLYIENQWGCSDSSSQLITIKPVSTFYIPNAFTPNGDGVNDYFHPFGNNIDPDDYQLLIFNRWGKQVFRSDNLNTPWDGRSKAYDDQMAPQGVYVYFIKARINGVLKTFEGTVTLIH